MNVKYNIIFLELEMDDISVIDLFSGAGGLTEGFVREGFKIAVHVEKEKWACETLKTRICYHYLKQNKDIGTYMEYLNKSINWRSIDQDRNIIFQRYPELEERLDREVINKAFGNPANDPGTTSSAEIIQLIEKALITGGYQSPKVIIGGPPCQAYSLIGRGRMGYAAKRDKRNFLFHYYKNIVKNFNPDVFIFENVPGILNARDGKVFPTIQEEFDKVGYTLLSGRNQDHSMNIQDARDFGVYQTRKRMVLFGYRSELNLQYPDLLNNSIFKPDKNMTTWDVISDLPALQPGEGNDLKPISYLAGQNVKLSKYQKIMRSNDDIGFVNHMARKHREVDREIYKIAINLAQHGEQLKYKDLPDKLKTHYHQNDFEDRFKVHWWKVVPHTIVAHISKDGHYNIHPDISQCRSLTVREAARIQSFPDDYRFEGPRTWQFTQVGNAVPPLMAQAIAKAVRIDCFEERKYSKCNTYFQLPISGVL